MIIKGKKLIFFTTNYQVSIWPLCMLAEMLMYYFYKLAGENYGGEVLGEWRNRTNRWAVNIEKYDVKITEKMLAKAERDKEWALKIAAKIPAVCEDLLKFTQKLFNADLSKKTDGELYNLYMNYRKKFIDMYVYAWFPNSLEGKKNVLTAKLENYLKLKLEKSGKYLSILITPLKFSKREKEKIVFLSLIDYIYRNKKARILFQNKGIRDIDNALSAIFPKINKLFANHCKKYCWLSFDYDGPVRDKNYFLRKAKELINLGRDPRQMIAKIFKEKEVIKNKQEQFIKELSLLKDKKFNYLFRLARELMYLKDYRKDILFKSYYHMNKLINEIGRRLSLSATQIKHILPREMKSVLLDKKYNINEINERIKYSVLLYEEAPAGKYPKGAIKIFTGRMAKQIVKQKVKIEKYDANIKEIRGQSAYPGTARGKVKLIFSTNDMRKMNQGDILVSPSTNPNLLPAMKKAAAIITDKGGITCHAAIVSRELRIPCIIGTEIATKILKDGQAVKVDATKGVVKL